MLLAFRLLLLCLAITLVLSAEDYYKLLGVSKSASDRELKKAYRNLSKKYHPDKNSGDEGAKQKFVEVADAYEALSDPESRKIYDQYGHEGLKQHKQSGGRQQGGHDPFDLFSRFFGGGGHFGGGGERKGPTMEVRVAVPLKDFYNGMETQFEIEKQGICDTCEGSGSADGKMENCGQCGGRGVVIQKIQLAPGMFQQMQSGCGACGGKGKIVKRPCKTCGGHRVTKQKETFTLNVEKGVPKNSRIVYESEGEESPDYVAGDLIVQIVEKEASLAADDDRSDGTFFRRKGKSLFWREVLSLREAWMGDWTRNLTHLDGHVVRLSRNRGEVVQPGMVEVVKGEGMPIWHEHREQEGGEDFGDLHVEYVVVLPDQMEKSMEKDFFDVWDKWRRKKGVDLAKDSGRPTGKSEL